MGIIIILNFRLIFLLYLIYRKIFLDMNIIFKFNVYVDLIGVNRNEIIFFIEKDFIVAINCILRL